MLRRMLMFAFVFAAIHAVAAETSKSRHFTFHYAFSVRGVEPGKPIQVWLPLAHSDRYQDVRVIATHGDLPLKQMRESEYGNRMLFASAKKAEKPEYKFSIDYDVVRREHLADGPKEMAGKKELARFEQPDKLVPVTGLPAFPLKRNPETDEAAYRCEAWLVEGSIQRVTTLTPCMGWALPPTWSTKKTEP